MESTTEFWATAWQTAQGLHRLGFPEPQQPVTGTSAKRIDRYWQMSAACASPSFAGDAAARPGHAPSMTYAWPSRALNLMRNVCYRHHQGSVHGFCRSSPAHHQRPQRLTNRLQHILNSLEAPRASPKPSSRHSPLPLPHKKTRLRSCKHAYNATPTMVRMVCERTPSS